MRGISPHIIVVDEIAFVSETFYASTVMPLKAMIDTPVFGITTPMPRGNWFMEVVNSRDEQGRLLFRSLNFEMVCPSCMTKGRAAMMKCNCKLGSSNSWRSQSIMDKMAKAFGDKITSQEFKGVSHGDECVFDTELLDDLCTRFAKAPCRLDASAGLRRVAPTFYGVYCDPNNGGRSGIGIVIAAHMGRKTRVSRLAHTDPRSYGWTSSRAQTRTPSSASSDATSRLHAPSSIPSTSPCGGSSSRPTATCTATTP